ncbi:MAG TPA: hypothetical protein VFO65_14640 [Acidimicrobiales bacterium]|nr:hypothetical protein [Acidimicrobiales bacterium]
MTTCRQCGDHVEPGRHDLCVACRRREVLRMVRSRQRRDRVMRAPDLEPAHSRPWVNRRGG